MGGSLCIGDGVTRAKRFFATSDKDEKKPLSAVEGVEVGGRFGFKRFAAVGGLGGAWSRVDAGLLVPSMLARVRRG